MKWSGWRLCPNERENANKIALSHSIDSCGRYAIPLCYIASIHKQSGKPNWFCAYYDEKGIRRFRTTGTPNKRDAEKLCLGFQKAAELAKAGRLTEDRARKVIESVVADIVEGSGGELKRFTVKEYFQSWVKSREGTSSASTHTRYEGIVNSFLFPLVRDLGLA